MMKKTTPDYLIDQITCDCDLFMCPICDVDFYVDLYREQTWEQAFEMETPF